MRGMTKNKQSFWYALYERSEPLLDDYGNEVGEISIYGKPVKATGNISAARGSTEADLFGVNAVYTKTINPMSINCPIDESSILWVGVKPLIKDVISLNIWGNDFFLKMEAKENGFQIL